MSATAALQGRVQYKHQLKSMWARTAVERTKDLFARTIEALQAVPAPAERIDDVTPSRPGYYGVFY